MLLRQDDSRCQSDIIQVNSKSGLQGSSRNAAYAGSKFGGIGLTQSFAMELVEDGIKVNAVCPGYVATPMTERSIEHIVARTGLGADEARRRLVAANPQGRLIEPEEVAALRAELLTRLDAPPPLD